MLERGWLASSLLATEFTAAMSSFRFVPSSVLVFLLDEGGEVAVSWSLLKAFPVKWSLSDLSAEDKNVVIETLELSYSRLERLGL